LGITDEAQQTGFTVQNVVCTAMLNEMVSLNALSIGLGLEVTEYEPEQFRVWFIGPRASVLYY